MRTPIIAGNWKMNKTIPEAIELANSLKREFLDIQGVEVVICPPFTALSEVFEILNSSNIKLGAQNMSCQEEGAFTGEVSAKMLRDAGCQFVILGHSERRQYFFETDNLINNKIKAALKNNLTPIVCVGETLDERENEKTFDVIQTQISGVLKDIKAVDLEKIIFAYEPVWAIGTGKNATSAQAEEVHKFIRSFLKKCYNEETANAVRIQYGGSVKPENFSELISQEDIDGALVGGASLQMEAFVKIVKQCLAS
jgi:triosephosphate isomerase